MRTFPSLERRWVGPAVFAGCGAVFVLVHVWHHLSWLRPLAERAPAGSSLARESLGSLAVSAAAFSGAAFAAFGVGTVALARRFSARGLWTLPVLAFIAWPLPAAIAFGDGRPLLRPLVEVAGMGSPSLFALGQAALVLAAALPFALRSRDASSAAGARLWAVAACAGFGACVYLVRQYGQAGSLGVNTSVHLPLAFAFASGVAMGTRRPWFPAAYLVVALGISEAPFLMLEWIRPTGAFVLPASDQIRFLVTAILPGMMALGLGALSDPLGRYLASRPMRTTVPDPV